MSDTSSSAEPRRAMRAYPHQSHLPPNPSHLPHPPARQLFDPRKDDPMRFSLLTRTNAKPHPGPPSGGYVSASATSVSDAQSMASNFSLTSGTTSSSASNPYSPANSRDIGGTRLWLDQMKRMYREITALESKILAEGDVVEEEPDFRTPSFSQPSKESEEKWARLVQEHKHLVELDHNFLSFALKPQVPASLQTLPAKYNIPARIWNHGFQRLLAALRRASVTSATALEHLESFIIYAYGFYCSLLEEQHLSQFRILWIEALGDLARYMMAVATHVADGAPKSNLLKPPVPMSTLPTQKSASSGGSHMDPGSVPSIGLHAAAELEMEDEKELWRRTAREWYTKGVKDTPGQGRLHHHLGLVCADAEGEELRAVYHFARSLVANHACDIARESILPLFSLAKQRARYQPSSPATSIFVLMQGILFTRIQLDDFQPTLARFIERVTLLPSEVSEADWTMMAILNICAMLEYGKPEGLLRRLCGLGPITQGASRPSSAATPKRNDRGDGMEVDIATEDAEETQDLSGGMMALSTNPSTASLEEPSYSLQLAFQATFEILSHAVRNPYIPSRLAFRPAGLNPYIPTILTFLATIVKHEHAARLVDRFVPWTDLALLFSESYRRTSSRAEDASRPTQKWFGSAPLPEDWCLRGSEWVRRVFERGFWRTSSSSKFEGITSEMDVLIPRRPATANGDASQDGIIVEDGEDGEGGGDVDQDWGWARWKRLRWCTETFVKHVPGLESVGEGRDRAVVVGGTLKIKVEMWRAQKAEEEEALRRRERRFSKEDTEMEIDDTNSPDDEEDDDDLRDPPEVRALKARRRYLRNLQNPSSQRRLPIRRAPPQPKPTRPLLQVVPGYTILVVDTNILLSSLPLVSDTIESHRWTVVVPLVVVTELDGLSHNHGELGSAASEALNYLIRAIQTHSASLKVQTSRGNYLHSLSIRSELGALGGGDRTMDDLILRSALWHSDHFVDRSNMLIGDYRLRGPVTEKTCKVVLLTFDRNLRLKARARQLDAADEKDMAGILSNHLKK